MSLLGPSLFVFSATLSIVLRNNRIAKCRFTKEISRILSTDISGDKKFYSYQAHWMSKDGEHKYLEDIEGDSALDWVKAGNKKCLDELGNPKDAPLYNRILSILDSKDKIPYVSKIGDLYYNFWQDENNIRGIYRRTTLESFRSSSPVWETVLDFDELGKREGVSWVYKGFSPFYPDDPTISPTRALVHLSRGGADATQVREFDLVRKEFVPSEEGGFYLPEAKNRIQWKDENTVFVGTDLKDGNSLTDSGYPRTVRIWSRSTALNSSTLVFEGASSDVSVYGFKTDHLGYKIEVLGRHMTFYTSKHRIKLTHGFNALNPSDWTDLTALPIDASISFFADLALIELRSDWTVGVGVGVPPSSSTSTSTSILPGQRVFPQGSLLSVEVEQFLRDGDAATFTPLFVPPQSGRVSLSHFTTTRNLLALSLLDNVKERVVLYRYLPNTTPSLSSSSPSSSNLRWERIGEEPEGVIRGSSLTALDSRIGDLVWMTLSSFTQPTSLHLVDLADGVGVLQPTSTLNNTNPGLVKSLPPQFDATGLVERQGEAVSKDGTRIPYFIISRADLPLDNSTPTLLYGYGGFEISMTPAYSSLVGAGWLEKGGCYVYANIRGGGEFGPRWHQAALKEKRRFAYDDFIAIAEDLVKGHGGGGGGGGGGITSPSRLAIRGGSNGGLLMGNMYVRRPDLFGAVVCQVPLLDMKRYNVLLAGASWMAEYGDPSKDEDWEYLKNYSAYHNIDPSGRTPYPPLLMTTSTRDDRVHPYHARSFVKRLQQIGENLSPDSSSEVQYTPRVMYYENMEGGHGGAADNKQQAFMNALYLDFLWKTIGGKK